MGRERQFVAFGCSRSAGILCRATVATRERPLSLSLTFSAACSKVKGQGRPVFRREIGHGQEWVETA